MPVPVMIVGVLALLVIAVGLVTSLRGGEAVVQERLGRYAEAGYDLGLPAERKPEQDERRSVLTDELDRALQGRGFADSIATQLARADLKMTVAEFLALQVIAVVAGVGITYFLFGGGILLPAAAGVIGFFGPRIYLRLRQRRRLNQFNDQLGDAINQMANGLRAGYSVMQAMDSVAQELPAPISTEFRRVVQEMQLGLSMEQALSNMLRRIDSEDLDLMITAINVQREVGGNLADILDVINFTIRERVRIKGEVRTLTAQGRASAYVITFLPVGLTLLLLVLNREYVMKLFTDVCGWIMVGTGILLIASGAFALMKITNIEV
jgi:tight adherence protein B